MRVTIEISDTASPQVKTALAAPGSMAVKSVMGRAVVNQSREHFRRLNSERPNKLGGTRTNFWAQVARSANHQVLADGFELGIAHVGLRQRWQGGTIRPQKAKMLTIPAIPEAYGKRAREFNNLRFAIIKGQPALIEAEATQIRFGKRGVKAKGSTLEASAGKARKVFYWLATSVYQAPDPSAMPTMQEFGSVAAAAAQSYVNRQLSKT
jgi:hypothetical protein